MPKHKLTYKDYVKKHLTGVYSISGSEEFALEIEDGKIIRTEILDADYDICDLEWYSCDLCDCPTYIKDPKEHWVKLHKVGIK